MDPSCVQDLNSDNIECVKSSLEKILEGDVSSLLSPDLPKSLNSALQNHSSISERICEVVAYLGRGAEFRTFVASDGSLMKTIVPLLMSSDDSIVLQTLRAIGNLCHDEDSCRQQFLECGGCPLLRDVLVKCSDLSVSTDYMKLKLVTCGCVLNTCCNNETLCKAMIDNDVLNLLCNGFLAKQEDATVMQMGLRALSAILDSDCCDQPTLVRSPVLVALVAILKAYIAKDYDDDDDIMESVLEIIETHCTTEDIDGDSWKVSVVNSGCFELLLELPQMLVPKVIDITVLLVSSDAALELLFSNKKLWSFIHSIIEGSAVTKELKASTVLIIANMARNGTNCEQLARDGTLDLINNKLMAFAVTEENSKLHYAIMSLLRNLSLPEANKLLFLQNDVLSKVLVVLNETNDPTVTMKVLGCLRLLSTKNEICKYISPSIGRVCELCEGASFEHIKIEGSRLIASLVKNSCDEIGIKINVVETDGLKWLVYLLDNGHMVVKNEGIVSLSLLASLDIALFNTKITCNDYNIIDKLCTIMETCSNEVLENCLTFLLLLRDKVDDVNEFLYTETLQKTLDTKNKLCEIESIQKKLVQLLENHRE